MLRNSGRRGQASGGTRGLRVQVTDAPWWTATRAKLHAFVARRIGPGVDPEDIVQDILLKIARHDDPGDPAERTAAWVYRVARNAIIDDHRRRASSQAAMARWAAQPLPQDAVDEMDESGTDSDLLELSGCLRPLLDQLPVTYREAIMLTDYQGLTQTEAARRTGVSVPGMKSRVQRGRRKLQMSLTACCEIEADSGRARGRLRADYCSTDGPSAQPNNCSC